ncbi:hypothetical protein KGM_215455 [Danaus plexippus plexippus]|uniref:Uncharacterized protein n=1 Tax=Danaus plexippus plexippus TaxID=278856 RepID=A0A212EU81_DANPL|nr:hypothetical protein KGM_215455 [Danaus plexippus plexippus]
MTHRAHWRHLHVTRHREPLQTKSIRLTLMDEDMNTVQFCFLKCYWALRSSSNVGRHGVADGSAVRLRADGEGTGGKDSTHALWEPAAFDLEPCCASRTTRISHRK